MIRHFFTRQFLRFVAVGGLAALCNWLSRIALGEWLPFGWAVALAYGVGVTAAFVLNSLYVFPDSNKPRAAQARDFFAVNLASFPVVWCLSLGFDAALQRLGMGHTEALAHALAIPVPMFAVFLIYKFFAFRETTTE